MSRAQRAEIAKQTMAILEAGHYLLPDGRRIDIAAQLNGCVEATQLLQPEDLASVMDQVAAQPGTGAGVRIEVANETTLAGITRLLSEADGPVAALNFASAKNPGGGFLGGSQAQEESLARSSGLHSSLMKAWPYYEQHRASPSALYTDAMILSPGCPVFRDDSGALLDEPQQVSFISSAAPNAGAVRENQPDEAPLIPRVLRRRAEYVLALAASRGYRHLVLGAWGCGVFRNDPSMVAEAFGSLLRSPAWSGRFECIRFSVFDTSPSAEVFGAFSAALDPGR